MGKSARNGPFSMAMLNNKRVHIYTTCTTYTTYSTYLPIYLSNHIYVSTYLSTCIIPMCPFAKNS